MKNSIVIPIAIVLGGGIVAFAVYLSQAPPTASGSGNPSAILPVTASDHIFGNPAAPVKIVEYADFDCEYCQGFNETMNQLIAEEGQSGQVAWVLRDFPITQLHPNAYSAAEAAECVAKTAGNAAFWNFEGALYQDQPVDPSDYGALAETVGAPGNAFESCYTNASTTVDAIINADSQNAVAVGAQGTPYSLILAPGQTPIVVDGAYSYAALKSLVDQALQNIQSQ